jgi:hypothetical protein
MSKLPRYIHLQEIENLVMDFKCKIVEKFTKLLITRNWRKKKIEKIVMNHIRY